MNDKHVISKEYWIWKPNAVFPYPGATPKAGYLFKVPFLWSNKKKMIAPWFNRRKHRSHRMSKLK